MAWESTVSPIPLLFPHVLPSNSSTQIIVQDIPEENYVGLAQSNFANALCYFAALGLVKAALLVFYLRLDPRKITRYFIFFVLFTVAGLEIASCLIIVFECQPVHKFWDLKNEVPGKCMDVHDRQIFYNANGIINIIQDIIIYVLPIPMLWNLQMPKRQKMALISLFSFGSIAVVASCVRYHYNAKLNSATDLYWYLADALNWCTIELYIAIICGSASTFKILIKRYAPSLWGSNRSKGASGDPSSQGYDQSHSGQFSMRNLKPSSKLAGSTSRRGLHDITTTIGHDSEEAIVDPNQPRAESPGNPYDNKNDIIIKREMRFEVSDSRSEDRIDCNPAQPRGGW